MLPRQPNAASKQAPNVVAIGGGTGLPNLLQGLKAYTPHINISAIVTTFDDGGSSGILRKQHGIPALGDIRRCLTALAPDGQDADSIADIFSHRFDNEAGLDKHSLGNLILAALIDKLGDLTAAVDTAAEILNAKGKVIPVATQPGHLRAQLSDGSWINSESEIDNRTDDNSPIKQIQLHNPVEANPQAISAIQAADIITAGPGDLYTSIIPNLLPDGIADAIRESPADLVFICNIRNKPAETANFNASDHVQTFNSYIAPRNAGAAILNIPSAVDPHAILINQDTSQIAPKVTASNLASTNNPQNHDPEKLAQAVLSLSCQILHIPVNQQRSSRPDAAQ